MAAAESSNDKGKKNKGMPKPNNILYATGDMLESLHPKFSSSNVALGFSDEKALWHHEGTNNGLPARELLGISAEDEDNIYKILTRALDAG